MAVVRKAVVEHVDVKGNELVFHVANRPDKRQTVGKTAADCSLPDVKVVAPNREVSFETFRDLCVPSWHLQDHEEIPDAEENDG